MEKLEMLLMMARMVTYYIVNYEDILAMHEDSYEHGYVCNSSLFLEFSVEDIEISIKMIDHLIDEITNQRLEIEYKYRAGHEHYIQKTIENLGHARNIQIGIDNGWDLDKVEKYIQKHIVE